MADIIDSIRSLGDEIRAVDARRAQLLETRRDLVLEARSQGMTWRELATALGMTEHGLIKMSRPRPERSSTS